MSRPLVRGRKGWERRLAERSDELKGREESEEPAERHEAEPREFEGLEPSRSASGALIKEPPARPPSIRAKGAVPAARGPQLTSVRPDSRAPGPGRRLPDIAALPPLLGETTAFATLSERLGPPDAPASKKGHHAGIVAVPHGAKSYLAAALALTAGERICWVARDAEIGDRVAEELAAWIGDPAAIAVLEPRTALAYERSELVADETASRVAALAKWRSGDARILVASVQALIQHTIAAEDLPERPRELRVGARLSQSSLLHDLLELGYVPTLEVAGKGEFARRGGLVDVFPPSAELPVRVEFFGDEIESLRAFDPTDQRSTGAVDRVTLLPASEFLLPGCGQTIRERLGKLASGPPERLAGDLARFEVPRESRVDSRAIDIGDAAEVWAPFLAPAVGLDHLPAGTLLVLDEPADLAEAGDFLWRQAEERRSDLVEAGDLPKAWPSTYLTERDWAARLLASRTLELTWESEAPRAMAQGRDDLGNLFGWREPTLPLGRAARIADAVARWRGAEPGEDGERVEPTTPSGPGRTSAGTPARTPPRIVVASDQAPRLAELLEEAGQVAGVTNAIADVPPPGSITLVDRSLNGGFEGGPEGLVFVTDRELFGSVRVRRPKAMRRVVPRDILERLTTGDLVVHIDHGIARYERMLRRSSGAGDERDYLELSFAAGDRIFVPVEQIARISRYSGGERPQLSRLGGTDWLRTKQRVSRAVTDLAEELLGLYAARASTPGHAYPPDTPWQAEMEASFPYEETVDQLRAVVEVKHDMESARPMDRIVVGDVGYGKTEVALRAAFKATQDGRQVAVLVPTTILAAQHHETFSARFAAFPVNVAILSRFVSRADQAKALAGLADGTVDIVIGTHRLLSRDVRFRDLGVLIVDEEQRFGVAAKERLKQLRREIDVLTLSATPIPRTLNLALAGVRDMSVIETPPEDRLPIQTRVAEASAGLVRDAILRELDRGGQVFYVHNRVETIEAQAEQLRRLLPDARLVVGHGQMPEGLLEDVMLTFAHGEADVLVCTTIIESGLDIPNANTIVIDRADALGLAQLYQLRGRVGRSSRRAYAYLLYRRRERMSEDARKRLQAIFNASELGAGFQIALSDLEIRGAGNILGGEQSGHMAAVGFDLYSRLLAEAVERRKAEHDGRAPVVPQPQAVVDLPIEAHLPDDFVPDEAQKLELYRRLARARTPGDIAAFRQEVIDRFGPMPAPVLRLVEVAELRLAAEAVGVASMSREEGQLVVRFGVGLSRATAMRLITPDSLPGVRHADVTFASNQVRIRLPKDPLKGWQLTQSVVARLSVEAG